MANKQIKIDLLTYGIKHYELAEALGISEFTLCRWLRKELSIDKKDMIIKTIEKLSKGAANGGF